MVIFYGNHSAAIFPKNGTLFTFYSIVHSKMHNLQLSSSYYITFICILHIAQWAKIRKIVQFIKEKPTNNRANTRWKHIIYCTFFYIFSPLCIATVKVALFWKIANYIVKGFLHFCKHYIESSDAKNGASDRPLGKKKISYSPKSIIIKSVEKIWICM